MRKLNDLILRINALQAATRNSTLVKQAGDDPRSGCETYRSTPGIIYQAGETNRLQELLAEVKAVLEEQVKFGEAFVAKGLLGGEDHE